MVRNIVAVIVGLIAGSAFNMAIIMVSWMLYPPPAGVDLMKDPEAMKAYVATLSLPAILIVLVAHAGGALVGGLVASAIARRSPTVLGAIVGGFFLLGGIVNAISIPAPLWFVVLDLILYVPCGILGARLIRPKAPA